MSYLRVIPRDLFNEASLLKCLGRVAILLDGKGFPEAVDDFNIVQSDDDGSISADNMPLTIGQREWRLCRPLNSRRPWPLYARSGDDEIEVFDDSGEFTEEMIALLRS